MRASRSVKAPLRLATLWESVLTQCTRLIVPAKQRRLIHKQVEVVLGADLAVPMVHGALKTSAPFSAHLQQKVWIELSRELLCTSHRLAKKRGSIDEFIDEFIARQNLLLIFLLFTIYLSWLNARESHFFSAIFNALFSEYFKRQLKLLFFTGYCL